MSIKSVTTYTPTSITCLRLPEPEAHGDRYTCIHRAEYEVRNNKRAHLLSDTERANGITILLNSS